MPRVKLFNKNEALKRATDLFWKKGFFATSIQDLVSALGISRSSLYDTFGGKKALFNSTLENYCSSNIEATKVFLEQQTSVKQGFYTLFEMLISESTSDIDRKGCFVVNTTTELASKDSDIRKKLENNKSTFENMFYEFLLTGQKSGEISKDKDIKAISSLIYTFVSGIKVVTKVEPNKDSLLSSAKIILSLLD